MLLFLLCLQFPDWVIRKTTDPGQTVSQVMERNVEVMRRKTQIMRGLMSGRTHFPIPTAGIKTELHWRKIRKDFYVIHTAYSNKQKSFCWSVVSGVNWQQIALTRKEMFSVPNVVFLPLHISSYQTCILFNLYILKTVTFMPYENMNFKI